MRYQRMVVKIGFTPRAIRRVRPSWQHSSSGAISRGYRVLSLIVASWGAHTQFKFQKYPFFRPLSTPSGVILRIINKKGQWAAFPANCTYALGQNAQFTLHFLLIAPMPFAKMYCLHVYARAIWAHKNVHLHVCASACMCEHSIRLSIF